ncbi:MAG TPA: cysteine synthase family protein [candidate division Zixibacteria bacterium]|nr:cysteine synthase family protein [candidate division Zixibacteria bacterium]
MSQSEARSLFASRPAPQVASIFTAVGGTPVVEIELFRERFPQAQVSLKLEYLNPGGSLKDRPVSRIILRALQTGQLTSAKTILDSSSGNAGIAYALFGAALGLRVTLVVPGNASAERLARIRAHGATVITTDPLEGYDEAIYTAQRLYHQSPERYFYANQYANENNWRAHYDTTAEEILAQAPGLTHFVAGVGTGGSLTGIARKLKERVPSVTIVAAAPETFPGIEGLKPLADEEDYVPEIFDRSLVNRWVSVESSQARAFSHRLAREGIFAGHSTGAYLAAVEAILTDEPRARIVTLACDTGERYLSAGLWEGRE